jgi:diguanylate cyclase (GGDEF)-like protein
MSFSSPERPRKLSPVEQTLAEKNAGLEAEVRHLDLENWGRQGEQRSLEEERGDLKAKVAELETAVGIDHLTGARSRKILEEELNRILKGIHESVGEHRKEGVSVIFIDLDHFKRVNDTYGHATGDIVLRKVVELMHGPLRETDMLARYGGDEFSVLLPNTNEEHAMVVAEKIRKVFEDPELAKYGVTASLGVCSSETVQAIDAKTFINKADKASYTAKKNGKDAAVLYRP